MEKPHKRLDAWKEAISLVTLVYEQAKNLPKTEEYGLASQIRRAALSIPANIAEGAARQTTREFIQFLYIARGSLSEIDTLLEIASNLEYLEKESLKILDRKITIVDKILTGLVKSLRKRSS